MESEQILSDVEQDIQNTIAMIKQYWPDYSVTADMLKRPTREFVLTFYSNCVENINQKISHAIGIDHPTDPQNLLTESYLYSKLREIPSLVEFKLGDLYKFNPLRTRQFMKLVMHFLIYTELYMDKALAYTQEAIEAHKLMDAQRKQMEELQELKQEKITQVGRLVRETQELSKAREIVNAKYEEIIIQKKHLDGQLKEKRMELEKLNEQFKQDEMTLQHYTEKEDQLRNEIITEQDYKNLINTVELLKQEELTQTAAIKDLQTGFKQCQNSIGYLKTCLSELNDLSIPDEIFDVTVQREEYKKLIKCNKDSTVQQQSREEELKLVRDKLENERKDLEGKFQRAAEALECRVAENVVAKAKIESQYLTKRTDNEFKLNQLSEQINRKEEDTKKLEEGFRNQYERMRALQETFMKRAIETLKRYEDNM